MKKTILLFAGFLFFAFSASEAQVVRTSFKGGGVNVIPNNFSSSGETRIYTCSPGDDFNNSIEITVYGNDFSTVEKEFTIQKPYPTSRKAEYASISLKDLSMKFQNETLEKTRPYFLRREYYDNNADDYVTIDMSDVDALLAYYNSYAEQIGLPQYESINSPDAFANIMSLFGRGTRAENRTGWIGFSDEKGNICCYYQESYYELDYYFYNYEENGYKYPLDFYTIENNVVYHVEKEYGWKLYFPENYTLNWKQVEYRGIEESVNRGFMDVAYSNFDFLSILGGGDNSPLLTQTLFNSDDKYEYFTNNYEVGDWKTIEECNQDDNIYVSWGDYGITNSIYVSYLNPNNHERLQIANLDSVVTLYNITTTNNDTNNFYLYRNQYFRGVKEVGFKVLSDDGSVVFNYEESPDADEGVEVYVFTYNGRNYMYIYDLDAKKNAYNYSIYEILPDNTSVKVIERINQPFASAQDGIINMQLDDSHTNSNAELYNMTGQSVVKRYISKGETRPQINATGLPDGIYNLILNRNGETISSQKMLIK